MHAERDVFLARALDRPRGPHPTRVRVQQQRDHHRRLIRRPAAPVAPIGAIERLKIHLAHRVQHEPREVPRRQPLTHVGRHQKRLITITRDETLSHHQMVLNPPDDTPTYATASGTRDSGGDPVPPLLRTESGGPESRCRPGVSPAAHSRPIWARPTNRGGVMSELLLDRAGRRRSPATLPIRRRPSAAQQGSALPRRSSPGRGDHRRHARRRRRRARRPATRTGRDSLARRAAYPRGARAR